MVLQKFVHKTNDANDNSFDLQSIIGHLTGGVGLQDVAGGGANKNDGGGIMGQIKGMFN